jgi:flagellar M-ring protein FliF
MDVLKAQLAKIQQQLSGLTASQKMLAAALVAIMAMTLTYMARYAGQADLEPLLNQSFLPDDIAQITAQLDAKSIRYTVTGDRILVPSDQKVEVLADLGFNHLLPERTNTAFDDIIKQMTPWDPADKTAQLWLEAKSRYLQEVLDKFPHVRAAYVMIDPSDQRRFDGHDVTPTAMVYITTARQGDDADRSTRQIAMGAADMVAGAVAGLARSHVTVVVDGATIPVPDQNAEGGLPDGDTIVTAIRQNEEMYRDKIMQQLGFIKGLFVSVRVDLNTKSVDTQETVFDPKAIAAKPVTEEDHTVDSTTSGAPAEPGATANLTTNGQLSVGGGGAGGSNTTEETTKSNYENHFSSKVLHTMQGPGDAPPVSASVRVPRSYFIQTYKDTHKDADPDDTELAALMTEETAHIVQDVKNCTGIKDDAAVAVNWYSDGAALSPGIPGPAAAPGGSALSLLLTSHLREIGVGGLAMFSLFMVMRMVRKSGPIPIPAVEENMARDRSTQRLGPESQVAGEAGEGEKMMDGMELDEEAVKTQQVIEQVSNMVTENPDAAANLVKRWLNRA